MTQEVNPIQESIKYLIECGWSEDQAKNLMKAIHDKSGERLWEVAPLWIQHCGECKQYVDGLLGTVALGLVKVSRNEDDAGWNFGLNETGLKVGEQMFREGE
jgi:hypothetical protein